MNKWNRKLNQFFKKYTTPFTFATSILTVLGYLAEHLTDMRTATIICYLVATVLAGLPILFRAITGLRMKAIG